MLKVALYGISLALIFLFLKYIEYNLFIRQLPMAFYFSVIAVLFTSVGVWAGSRLTAKRKFESGTSLPTAPKIDFDKRRQSGISQREFEVLELMATGLTNQQIADRLNVSINTIKTQSSSLFLKLDVNRRTQAIQKAKQMQLIP